MKETPLLVLHLISYCDKQKYVYPFVIMSSIYRSWNIQNVIINFIFFGILNKHKWNIYFLFFIHNMKQMPTSSSSWCTLTWWFHVSANIVNEDSFTIQISLFPMLALIFLRSKSSITCGNVDVKWIVILWAKIVAFPST